MALPEPHWTEEELALHVAYEQCPRLRALYPTFERAMAEPAVARALRLCARARLRRARPETTTGESERDHYWPDWKTRRR